MIAQHPFHILLPQQAPTLRRRALNLTGNEARADDLVQTTFLKAWASRDSYCSQTNLRAWLFTILRNTFFSDLRKRRREVEDIDGFLAASLSEEPRQDHALALEELIVAIGFLPEAQRKPLVMMGAFGFSQLETAKACDCTVGTIKSRVSRSRTTLARMIALEDFQQMTASQSRNHVPAPLQQGRARPLRTHQAEIAQPLHQT
jgi:RNA polymerase sigma-70 factor (ECF subfamily)